MLNNLALQWTLRGKNSIFKYYLAELQAPTQKHNLPHGSDNGIIQLVLTRVLGPVCDYTIHKQTHLSNPFCFHPQAER